MKNSNNVPHPGDFPLGSPESRAAARLRLEQMQDNRRNIEIISHIPRPGQDNTQPHASPWRQMQDGLFRILYVPSAVPDVAKLRTT